MSKRRAHVIGPGRPKRTMGSGREAPGVYVKLDAESEAALLALGNRADGAQSAPEVARAALRAEAGRVCPAEYAAALTAVRARRERDAR